MATNRSGFQKAVDLTPEDRSVFLRRECQEDSELKNKIGIGENAKPERITDFTSGRIFDFALSADGKNIIFAKGSSTSDIVIFRKSN